MVLNLHFHDEVLILQVIQLLAVCIKKVISDNLLQVFFIVIVIKAMHQKVKFFISKITSSRDIKNSKTFQGSLRDQN